MNKNSGRIGSSKLALLPPRSIFVNLHIELARINVNVFYDCFITNNKS